MLHNFLTANRIELIARCRVKVAQRSAPAANARELDHGIAMFLDQLIKTLQVEQTSEPLQSRKVSGPSGGDSVLSEVGEMATRHGRELLTNGFTIDQVVHDYGDLCQAITDLAFELEEPFEIDEFRTLNRCLDNAIADAVKEFSYQRDFLVADGQTDMLNKRIGFFAHELRNLLNSATLALKLIKDGDVAVDGATSTVLDRSLLGMRALVDRHLTEIRMAVGMPVQYRLFSLADFIGEVKLSASLEAGVRECALTVAPVDSELAIDGERDLLLSAVGNLLQNAFKFTHRKTEVTLSAYASGDRILIDVSDHCGGITTDEVATMFVPFAQSHVDKSGLGLGLSISRQSVEANNGSLSVRNMPGIGCVFTVSLPRHAIRAALN